MLGQHLTTASRGSRAKTPVSKLQSDQGDTLYCLRFNLSGLSVGVTLNKLLINQLTPVPCS